MSFHIFRIPQITPKVVSSKKNNSTVSILTGNEQCQNGGLKLSSVNRFFEFYSIVTHENKQ